MTSEFKSESRRRCGSTPFRTRGRLRLAEAGDPAGGPLVTILDVHQVVVAEDQSWRQQSPSNDERQSAPKP